MQLEQGVVWVEASLLGLVALISFWQVYHLRRILREYVPLNTTGDLDQGLRTLVCSAFCLCICTVKYALLSQGYGRMITANEVEFGMLGCVCVSCWCKFIIVTENS
jgi:hypothetical protein